MSNIEIFITSLCFYIIIGVVLTVLLGKVSYLLAWPIHLLIETYRGLMDHIYE